jgi:ATP-dependent exoDNAse (exonuclease V) alpha subunit
MEDISDQSLMLVYVAVTRAKRRLDTTQLESFHRRRELRAKFADKVGS